MAKELFETWDDELELCIADWKAKYPTASVDDRNKERAIITEFCFCPPLDPLSCRASFQEMLEYIQQDLELAKGQGIFDVSAGIAGLLALMMSDVELSDTSRARLEKFAALAIQLGMAYEQFLFRRERELAGYGAKRREKDKQSARKRLLISEDDAYKRCEALKREHSEKSDRWISIRLHEQLKAENGEEAAAAAETIRKKWLARKKKEEIPF